MTIGLYWVELLAWFGGFDEISRGIAIAVTIAIAMLALYVVAMRV